MTRTSKSIPIGSGYLHLLEYTSTLAALPTLIGQLGPRTRFGTTTGGATLTYTGTIHEEKDDLGTIGRVITTEEEVKLKAGIFSWEPGMFAQVLSTARVDDTDQTYKILRIGGLNNDNGKKYVIVFEHIDRQLGNLYVVIVGSNTNGLSLAFAKDNTTKLEPEFTATPQDDDGTLCSIVWPKNYTPGGNTSQTTPSDQSDQTG